MLALAAIISAFFLRAGASPPFASPKIIYQSSDSLFFENIAVLSSSQLLLTSVVSPTLHSLDPTTPNATLRSVFTFPNSTSLTGIAQLGPRVFAVAASVTNNTTRRTTPGSVILWYLDFTNNINNRTAAAASTPAVSQLATLPEASSANGLSALPGYPYIVLVADSVLGAVWQADACSGTARSVLQDPSMLLNAPPPTLGINGLHVQLSSFGSSTAKLVYSTSGQSALFEVPLAIDAAIGNVSAAGPVSQLADFGNGQAPDDFALDKDGRAWVAVHPGELVVVSNGTGNGIHLLNNQTQIAVAGNANGTDPRMNQPTSAAFGGDKMLYVTTGVGQVVAVNVGNA